jgi:hypothetical protein
MSVSKVTLLGKPKSTYTIVYGTNEYMFVAGRPRKVPVAIALEAKKRKDRRGKPLFEVKDLPKIITPAPSPVSEKGIRTEISLEQNVPTEEQQQLTFGM